MDEDNGGEDTDTDAGAATGGGTLERHEDEIAFLNLGVQLLTERVLAVDVEKLWGWERETEIGEEEEEEEEEESDEVNGNAFGCSSIILIVSLEAPACADLVE